MPINICSNIEIKTLANNILKCVEGYKYLEWHILCYIAAWYEGKSAGSVWVFVFKQATVTLEEESR